MTVATLQDRLAERFLRYSTISSQSDASRTTVPTSEGQRELAQLLEAELRAAGAADVHLNETSVLTARIPSTLAPGTEAPAIGFCTHLDTVDVGLSPIVRARVVEYVGGDIELGNGVVLSEREHPEVARYAGDRIIVTDGTSVLGADDKAAVATVMQMACDLLADPSIEHGDVYLSFVPDEEIGLRGVRTMDPERFPVAYAFTLDSCELGEMVEETFNAAGVTISITGVTAHPMSSKGVLVNPILIANSIISRLDRLETPEHTEGREGYIWVNGITGDQATASVKLAIRDHDRAGYEEKKERLVRLVREAQEAEPRARVEIEIEDIYGNIADARTEENAVAVESIYQAMRNLGITPLPLAMRGGTDGSWLSAQGMFTPNIFTGAHNFHSTCEFLPLSSFEKSYQMVRELVRLASD